MKSSNEKKEKIKRFINNYMRFSKKRPSMYGDIREIEGKWNLLDNIFLILNGFENKYHILHWGAFLSVKGYGSNDAAHIIKKMRLNDPYQKLVELRNEYEIWRNKKIKGLKNKKTHK